MKKSKSIKKDLNEILPSYYERNREKCLEYQRKYNEKNRLKIHRYQSIYYASNSELIQESRTKKESVKGNTLPPIVENPYNEKTEKERKSGLITFGI